MKLSVKTKNKKQKNKKYINRNLTAKINNKKYNIKKSKKTGGFLSYLKNKLFEPAMYQSPDCTCCSWKPSVFMK